jgi:hypothetical protein
LHVVFGNGLLLKDESVCFEANAFDSLGDGVEYFQPWLNILDILAKPFQQPQLPSLLLVQWV